MKASIKQILGWTGTEWIYAPFAWTDDLATAKSTMVSITNTQAYNYLQPTDWLVVRQVENSTPIPADWNTWRQLIRDEAAEKNSVIESCESKETLNEYCQSDAYLTWSDSPTTPI
jgi:hypothetical protein